MIGLHQKVADRKEKSPLLWDFSITDRERLAKGQTAKSGEFSVVSLTFCGGPIEVDQANGR
jgi:hypothetical protein